LPEPLIFLYQAEILPSKRQKTHQNDPIFIFQYKNASHRNVQKGPEDRFFSLPGTKCFT